MMYYLKKLAILLLLPLCSAGQSKRLLSQDYNFLQVDEEVYKLKQSNDTLYELKCFTNKPCFIKPRSHYKILVVSLLANFTIVKLEKLDTLQLTTNPYPAARFCILAFKQINGQQLGYLPLKMELTQSQVMAFKITLPMVADKFYFTYYSDGYVNQLTHLKAIKTKEEAQEIMQTGKSDTFKPLIDLYQKTETRDMYAAGLSAELLVRACILKGYNPIGAGKAVQAAMAANKHN